MVMRPLDRAIDHPQIRTIDRITNAYIVTVIEAILRFSPFDPVDSIILALINAKNVSTVAQSPDLSRRYADWAHPIPDAVRQPISRRAVAASLNLPVETVRRRIDRLIKLGVLVEVEGGVIVTAERDDAPARSEFIFASNFQLLRRMLGQFRAHGIDLTTDLDAAPQEPETSR